MVTTTLRRAATVVIFLFVAGAAFLSKDQFATSAPPDTSGQDPADPKFAGHFSGQVLNPDGKPLAGARVYLVPDDRASHRASTGAGPLRAKTDSNGRFEFDAPDMTFIDFDGLPSRRPGLLMTRAAGYAPDWTQTWGQNLPASVIALYPVKEAELTLQLAADDVPIHGLLLDPDGRPVSGARVEVVNLRVPRHRDLDAHLARVANSNFLVCAPPVERWIDRPDLLPNLATETRTDLDGRFTLSGLGRDRLARLSVSAPEFVDTSVAVMTRVVTEVRMRQGPLRDDPEYITHGADFTLQLQRGLTVSGLVRDRDSQEPIPGMWVGRNRDPLDGLLSGEYSQATDASGRFTITGVDPRVFEWDQNAREIMAVSPPGMPYRTAIAEFDRNGQIVIECARGVPFRLKLVDQQGQPVEAEVTYSYVQPNPRLTGETFSDLRWPTSRAANRGDGIYEGFVLPGPGAVLVKTPGHSDFRPARVDPKAFFAPGRTEWTTVERNSEYGTPDTLIAHGGWINQHDYAAIVLVNPAPDSGPLELSAAVVRDTPRRVSLVDSDGQPVVGVETLGMTFHPWDAEPPLRAATFPLRKLHPDRVQRIRFYHEQRKLIGILFASADGDTPYTVLMQPWAAVTGRLVDPEGNPLSTDTAPLLDLGDEGVGTVLNPDPNIGVARGQNIEPDGLFRIDRLIPGQRYSGKIYRGVGMFAGMAFENLVVGPGEARDLGDIRSKPPVDVRGK